MDYIPFLRSAVTDPLVHKGSEGASEVVDRYQAYDLTRDDVDTIMELGQWSGQPDLLKQIEPKVDTYSSRYK